jgi:valyl-tRNA synthetase
MAGFIDTEAEIQRLSKEIAKLDKEIARLSGKLSNQKFMANAPAEVVKKEQEKLSEQKTAIENLNIQILRLRNS